jgi:hypothetical protein
VLMSLWSFQGARELETSPPAEITAAPLPGLHKRHGRLTDLSKLNSALAGRIAEAM